MDIRTNAANVSVGELTVSVPYRSLNGIDIYDQVLIMDDQTGKSSMCYNIDI